MKLYGAKGAGNPRRVKIYLVEKGINDIEQIDFIPPCLETRTEEFLSKNPNGMIPVLELDDGTWLPESAAIIEFIEELYPDPSMLGESEQERAWVRAHERMVADLFVWMRIYLPHKYPPTFDLPEKFISYPEAAMATEPTVNRMLKALDTRIAKKTYLTNSVRPMIPDCHLFALLSGAVDLGWDIPRDLRNLQAWRDNFATRESAGA